MSDGPAPASGVAELADRPVDGRRVALVMAAVGLALALACGAGIEQLLRTANAEPEAARLLRREARPDAGASSPARVAIVLVDGLRTDEAAQLETWRRLAPRSATGAIALPTPTLSRPFYHLLLTGVPHDASGVRSNRFDARARHDSVADRVRDAGGRVFFVSEGLDWMRRMHGRPGDGGSDERASVGGELPQHLRAWRSAPAPALLVVHLTSTDSTAHRGGIDAPAHGRALARADRVLERVAAFEDATLFALSDHGHLRAGGHGGPEPEVAVAPLLVRGPGIEPASLGSVDAARLASTIAARLGVAAPRSAIGAPVEAISGVSGGSVREHHRLGAVAMRGRRAEREALALRRRLLLPLALFACFLALGPIKRAYGFDRSVAVAVVLWPVALVAIHLVLDRPLSLSALDTRVAHGVRVAVMAVLATATSAAAARILARDGTTAARTRRVLAAVGWSALSCALLATANVGFALGPWPLEPRESYLALLSLGAAAPSLATVALALAVSARSRSEGATIARSRT